jgi:N-acetylmuramoyl-L-alanine amidase
MRIIQRPSPNYNDRPRFRGEVGAIVLHGTAGKSVEGDVSWIQNPDSKVSYHYVVGRDGDIYQCVREADRAWHAGTSEWGGVADLNDYSIGIGISNRGPVGGDCRNGGELFPTPQIMATAELVVDICDRYRIPWRRILTHAQVSPGRKTDPWLHFPMGEFAGALLSFQTIRGAA